MPIISMFYGIKVLMYWDDRFPAHFHAEYGEFKALIDIKDVVVIKGMLPGKQLKLVLAWCEIHKEELIKNWKSAKENEKLSKIDPLK